MDDLLPSLTDREVVLISHANPEDNAFVTWLTLRLFAPSFSRVDSPLIVAR